MYFVLHTLCPLHSDQVMMSLPWPGCGFSSFCICLGFFCPPSYRVWLLFWKTVMEVLFCFVFWRNTLTMCKTYTELALKQYVLILKTVSISAVKIWMDEHNLHLHRDSSTPDYSSSLFPLFHGFMNNRNFFLTDSSVQFLEQFNVLVLFFFLSSVL